MEEVRKINGVVEWRCACPNYSYVADMTSRAFPGRFEPVPFRSDCNLRFSVTSPGVLQNILATSVHLTPRYAIELMKAAGIGYERRIGHAVFVETHVNTAVAFFDDQREQSHEHHRAKQSYAGWKSVPDTSVSSCSGMIATECAVPAQTVPSSGSVG